MKITIQRETFRPVMEEGLALMQEHWREVAYLQDVVPLEPDFDKFLALENAGLLFVAVARDEGVMIGYAVFVLHTLMHYKSCHAASNDALFIKKEYRTKSTAGIRILKECEAMLKAIGVHRIFWHVKPTNDWTLVLKRMGYECEDVVMGKYIKE